MLLDYTIRLPAGVRAISPMRPVPRLVALILLYLEGELPGATMRPIRIRLILLKILFEHFEFALRRNLR